MSTLKKLPKNTAKITVNIAKQTLTLATPTQEGLYSERVFSVSTAKNGPGNQEGSGCTPLGRHSIAEKIGADMPANSVYVGRVATGEIYNSQLACEYPDRDWILTRIMWLTGCELGINKGQNEQGCCDSYQRYIYIHGTPETEPMGVPMSHGCVRMRNDDLIWLFDHVEQGTPVEIVAA